VEELGISPRAPIFFVSVAALDSCAVAGAAVSRSGMFSRAAGGTAVPCFETAVPHGAAVFVCVGLLREIDLARL